MMTSSRGRTGKSAALLSGSMVWVRRGTVPESPSIRPANNPAAKRCTDANSSASNVFKASRKKDPRSLIYMRPSLMFAEYDPRTTVTDRTTVAIATSS